MPTMKLLPGPALMPPTGFTLIELMIVFAVIGILAAIAVPSYQNYTIRAQITEGLNLAVGWKVAVGEYHAHNGAFPTCSAPTGGTPCMVMTAASTGKYVSSISVGPGAGQAGQITLKFAGRQANSRLKTGSKNVLDLTPGMNAHGDVIWVCGTAARPSTVTFVPSTVTTIPATYLPAVCRGAVAPSGDG